MSRKRDSAFVCLSAGILCLLATNLIAAENTGTISGKLIHPWVSRKYEMVVYVEKAPGAPFPKPAKTPVMDQIKRVYTPHVLPVVVGWEIEFRNSDPELHNVFSRFMGTQLFNQALPPGRFSFKKKMEQEGIVTLLCHIHQEMSAYVVVLQNPYFAVVPDPEDKKKSEGALPVSQAEFKIEKIPPGTYNLRVWGEKLTKKELAKVFPVVVQVGKTTTVELKP